MSIRGACLLILLACASSAAAQGRAHGVTATPVLDNPSVSIVRLHLAAGARELPQSRAHGTLIVLLSRGELELHRGGRQPRAVRKKGDVEYVAAGTSHYAVNAGMEALDLLIVSLKADRKHGGTTPPPQPLPGLSRTPLLDNGEVTVTRLEFEPDVRESVHTHPYDLIVIPLGTSHLDLQIGDQKHVRNYAPGEATFVPRGMRHAAANVGTVPVGLLGIAVK